MPLVSADIPESLKSVLDVEIARLRTNESAVITGALSKYLGIPAHTLFQVSTSGALVAGVYDREVSVKSILEHGDFGLVDELRGSGRREYGSGRESPQAFVSSTRSKPLQRCARVP
jgi:hypothetical protein